MTAKIKENIKYTLSTFEVEGLRPSKETMRLMERMESGKIELPEVLRAIEKQHGIVSDRRV